MIAGFFFSVFWIITIFELLSYRKLNATYNAFVIFFPWKCCFEITSHDVNGLGKNKAAEAEKGILLP